VLLLLVFAWCCWRVPESDFQAVAFVVGFVLQSLKVLLGVFGFGFLICIAVSVPRNPESLSGELNFVRSLFSLSGYCSFLPFLQSTSDQMATDTEQVWIGSDGGRDWGGGGGEESSRGRGKEGSMNWIPGLVVVSCWSAISRWYNCGSTDEGIPRREIVRWGKTKVRGREDLQDREILGERKRDIRLHKRDSRSDESKRVCRYSPEGLTSTGH